MASLNYNRCVIAGKLAADPELKTTTNGTSVCSFSVAVNGAKDKTTGQQKANFFHVTAWKERAEFVTRYFRKGSSILVEGKLDTRSWNDKDGNKRYVTEIVADAVYFVDSRAEAQMATAGSAAYIPEAYQMPQSGGAPKMEEAESEDDLPF